MPNFNEVTRDFIEYPIYYYDVTYSMSLPVRGIGGAAGVIMNGWDPINLVPSLVHVSAAGELSVAGSISATTSATATAAAPVYVEGSTDALSMDLGGALRVTGTISASSTVKSTAAAPSYVEGSSNPFSSDLAGGLRVTGAFFQVTQPVSLASSPNPSNLDVALSTRTKPSDQQHVIVDSSASVAVTGPLTDTQLRLTPVPVSGTVTATTGGLTDTQLRATPVPVSGTVTATTGGLTDAELRADAILVYVDPSIPVQIADNGQRIANMLAAQSLMVARAGVSGFVPLIEIPGFLAG